VAAAISSAAEQDPEPARAVAAVLAAPEENTAECAEFQRRIAARQVSPSTSTRRHTCAEHPDQAGPRRRRRRADVLLLRQFGETVAQSGRVRWEHSVAGVAPAWAMMLGAR